MGITKNPSKQSNLSKRSLLTFMVVGGFATGLQYFLTIIFVLAFELPVIQASALGFAISAVANYFLNARLTFRSKESHMATLPRYFVTSAIGLLVNYVVLSLLIATDIHPIPAQILTTLCVTIWNYMISGVWTFKKRTL